MAMPDNQEIYHFLRILAQVTRLLLLIDKQLRSDYNTGKYGKYAPFKKWAWKGGCGPWIPN